MTDLTEEQKAVLAQLTLAYPAGLAYEHPKAIQVLDSLVRSGHVLQAKLDEDDDVDGVAYQLAPEFAEAHQRALDQQAAEAGMN